MSLFDILWARKTGGGSGGSGGGSDYDGLLCYDTTNYIEMTEDFSDGAPMARVSSTCPDLTGKKCIMAGQVNENMGALIESAGEVEVFEETAEDGTPVKFYAVFNAADGTPLCVAVPEESVAAVGVNAGVWVISLYTVMSTAYIIFE